MKPYDKILSFENEFYKQLYEDGIQQRNQLNNKFTPTITLISAEISGIIWCIFKLINNIADNKNVINMSHLCGLFFLALTVVCMGSAIAFFILCFTNYNFSYPNPTKAKSFVEDNNRLIGEYSEVEIFNNIVKNISNDYINIAISNCEETNKHSSYLNKCYICIVSVLAFLAIDFVVIIF